MEKRSVKNDVYQKAMAWCLKNGIKIYPMVVDSQTYRIVIEDNGIPHSSEETYRSDGKYYRKIKGRPKGKLWHDRIWELYKLKYDEHHE